MKHIILWVLVLEFTYASTYTLNNVLKSATQHSTLTKALEQEGLALASKNYADTSSSPIELFGEGTKAYPELGSHGYEYTIGMSKTLMLNDIQEQEQRITHLSNQAYLLEEEKNILNFKNGLKNMYHHYCLDRMNYGSFKQSYREFVKLYKKKQKAYKYQEISKTELMQFEIEKNRLYAQLEEMKMQNDTSKQNLLMLSGLSYKQSSKFSCKDMRPIRSKVRLQKAFNLSKEAYKKRLQSTQETLDRYANKLDSIDLSVQYGKELDMDKYSVGFSLPLHFTSKKHEHQRVAAMHKSSAISYKHEEKMRASERLLSQLKSELKMNVVMLKTLQHNHKNYKKNFLPLIKKSYNLGETSVIEYLLSRQKSYQLREEIYRTKKSYYHTLFKLYTLSETKDY
ncbi:MAG: Unknown protein [uncultured Sulfurovum sp.]|uniref:Heavy metal RND efflux outer membrane protein, CzcC family n=1 Tax=uncultured Sulfurovum sp. TaxID=269237 RepID=A0A6S6S1A8_9BACT|nr:MAG: Unknown protein [uncultured Sulfurovum sp.]